MAFNRVLPLLFYTGLLLGWLPVPSMADPPEPEITHKTDHCIWYDECASSGNGFYNCLYNGPPKNLTDQSEEFIKLLNDTCPDIVAEGRGVCCNERQLNTLATQIKYPQQLFSRCPACLKNFLGHFCLTTCDPDQATWMNVTDIKYDEDLKKWSILDIELFVTPEYANRLYDSCKNVQYPVASTKVIDIMCGTNECNAEKWLEYLGSPSANKMSPFPMEYRFTNETFADGIEPKSYDFIECNTTDKKYQCSCSDCNAPNVCPPPPKPFPNTFSYIHVMIWIVSVGTSLSVLVFIVAMISAIISMRSKRGYTNIINKSSGGGQTQAKYGAIENENYSPTSSVGSINADETDLPETEAKDQPPRSSSVCECWLRMGRWIEYAIKWAFYHWGKFVAQYWYLVFIFAAIIALILACGLFFFKITTAPVDLWTSPTSRARQEKIYFDEHFSPFYRTEMLIITAPEFNNTYYQPGGTPGANYTFGPVFDLSVLEEVLYLQNNLTYMEVPYTDDNGNVTNITLSDICLKPLAPQNDHCTIMSVLNYFQNSIDNLNRQYFFFSDYHDHIYYCTRNPTDPKGANFKDPYMPCLGEFGGPIDPNVALGGFGFEPNSTNPDYQSAKALMVTFIVRNHLNESDNRMAETWEKAFLKFVGNYSGQYINITYSAERSIEDEIERESQAEILTILISYVLMFVYIMFFLGHIRSIRTLLVDIKVSIGFIGVLTVLVAVVASIGLLSYIHVMNTLIILEVVPFLVLAVGVDNFFILIHSYEREACKFAKHHKHDMSHVCVKELIGRSVGEVAPSLLLTSLSETAAFLLGGVSTMPAVRSFSFYAGVAVFFNFLLQISVFVGLMALDAHRQIANRVDVFFCFKLKGNYDPTMGRDIIHFIIKYFAKLILHPLVRPFVLLFFGLTSTGALALLFRTEIGLDQTLALPRDSYLIPYFNETFTYLHTGAPVYFVIKEGYDYTNETKQNAICSGAGCLPTSLGQQIVRYSTAANMTKIAEPAMIWLDTYFEWITPTSMCCGISRDEHGDECYDPKWHNDSCDACMVSGGDRPNKTEFETYIYWFLQDNPGIPCPSGGHAAFGGAVILNQTDTKHHKNSTVSTSYVMTYHTVLKTSDDFISALRWARRLADNVSSVMEWEVFPYSVFYVFYEQYLTTVHDMALNLGLSIGAVFIVTLLMFGLNLWAALILMLVVCMIILHMFGCMHLFGINANAVSLVNLVMTVGISVEFCSHIVRWFVSHTGRRRERAQSALDHMGASVFSGITVTKFLGVFVLLFAKSKLFNIYYFRMYMLMLFWGALHGLVFLPVILSYIGPPNVNFVKKPYSDLDLEEHEEEKEKSHKTTATKTASEGEKHKPNDIPPQPRTHPSMYPSPLDTNSDSQHQQPPPWAAVPPTQPTVPSQHPQVYQGYGPPTYPNQQVYQQQGVVYGAPSERSRLINQ